MPPARVSAGRPQDWIAEKVTVGPPSVIVDPVPAPATPPLPLTPVPVTDPATTTGL